jgi:uncharacterized protein (PEP-CTERM system associated)
VGGRNDNVRQHDATANLNYRLSPRTSALAVVGWGRSRSLTTDVVDTRRDFRLGLTHRLSREVRAAVDLNRRFGTYGRLGRSSGPFYENSISASLSAQF